MEEMLEYLFYKLFELSFCCLTWVLPGRLYFKQVDDRVTGQVVCFHRYLYLTVFPFVQCTSAYMVENDRIILGGVIQC